MVEKITLWDWIEDDLESFHMRATRFGRWCEWKDAKAIIDRQAALIRDLRAELKNNVAGEKIDE
jgi:hypothetical protein